MLCGVLGLVVLFLLLTNSATRPNPMADKWFSESPQSRPESAAGKQAGSQHLVHQKSAPYLQLDTYLAADAKHYAATCLLPSFAESCLSSMHKQTLQQSQPSVVAITPTATALSSPGGIAQGPTSRLTATTCTTAHMPAQSRALVLVPKLPVCSVVFSGSVLIVEAQHTLTIDPTRPMLKLLGQASAHMEDWCSRTAPAAGNIAVAPSLPDLACNDTLMCCLVGSLTQSQSAITTARATSAFAALRDLLKHAATHSDFLPDLRSWSWVQTLLLGAFMFSLGFVIPGTWFSALACCLEVLSCH